MINLHIGLNKTGSTSLQDFFARNRVEMRNRGLLYPDIFLGSHGGHHDLANYLRGEVADTNVDAALKEAMAFPGDVLFSSELLQTVPDLTVLRQLTGGRDVRVILYLRDPVSYMLSWWQEDIKADRIACTFDTYAGFYWKSYYAVLRRWADAFGMQSVRPAIYDRNQFTEGDILADFLGIMGREDLKSLPRGERENNASLSGNLLYAKLIYNSMGFPDAATKEMNAGLNDIALMRPAFWQRPQVSAETAARIEAWYAEDLNRVASEFGMNIPLSSHLDGVPVPNLATLADDLEFICEEAAKRGLGISRLRDILIGSEARAQ